VSLNLNLINILNRSFYYKGGSTLEEIELGTLLKNARQEKNLSLQDIQEATKIRKKYLEAIEANDFSVLPGNVYLKVFVKGYAREVGVDYQQLLANYEILHVNITNENNQKLNTSYLDEANKKSTFKRENKKSPWRFFLLLVIAVLIITALAAAYQYYNQGEISILPPENTIEHNNSAGEDLTDNQIQSDNSEIELDLNSLDNADNENLEQANNSQTSSDILDENTESIENILSTAEDNLSAGNNKNNSSDLDSETTVANNSADSESDNSNDLAIEQLSTNSALDSEEVQNTASLENENNIAEKTEISDLSADSETMIEIEASDVVWIRVDTDGNNVFSGILSAGDTRSFNFKQKIYLKIGNGSAVKAKINGEEYGPWAEAGQIAETEIEINDQQLEINNLRN
jgi:cytoskeletal protein RodZ